MTFAIYYTPDDYSFSQRIMGRQAAGNALLQGVARSWDSVAATGLSASDSLAMLEQLRTTGYTGEVVWSTLPDMTASCNAGTLYYPAPPSRMLAAARNEIGAASFSLMGVTHSLSSLGVTEKIADLLLPPFQPWDALICTSQAAHSLVTSLHDEMRTYWKETTGATRFSGVQIATIPLGVNVPDFARSKADRDGARQTLGIRPDQTVFLMAGRLAFHAKANPVVAYQALETLGKDHALVCIEAGIHPNEQIADAYRAAQASLAPSVRFLHLDGNDREAYRRGWHAADIFMSLSDNIQETFGLTPLEAMASGLPVIVSDWDGYKDTVRDGIDGYRIPTYFPQPILDDSVTRYALGRDDYDMFIGRASLATVIDTEALIEAMRSLIVDVDLRHRMGDAARTRVAADFDWPKILTRYTELATELAERRSRASIASLRHPVLRSPFERFSSFPTAGIDGSWGLEASDHARQNLARFSALSVANYGFDPTLFPKDAPDRLLDAILKQDIQSVDVALAKSGMSKAKALRALMWLWKFGLVGLKR